MADEVQNEETTEETVTEGQESTEEVEAEQEQEESAEEEVEEESEDSEFLKKEVKRVRSEAASWRTKYRNLEAKLAEAKTPEEFAAARDEANTTIRSLERELIATKFNLPEELSEVLKGDTREELEAHAKKLSKYAPASGEDRDESGGLNTFDPREELDPRKLAAKARPKRRF